MTPPAAEPMCEVAPFGGADLPIEFGMSQQAFRERHFEKNYCLLRGALKDTSFAWSDVDELLHRIDPLPPLFNVFKDGSVAPDRFIEQREVGGRSRIDKARLYELLQSGASVVMNRLEDSSLVAQRLCQTVGRFAGHTATSNAYLSFGGTGTFGRHWDTHDVFVIQLLGTKRWQVFTPTWRNPLSFQVSGGHEHSCPSEPVLDCELKPGDVLYVPRGWWHRVIPSNSGSFHLSVGTYAPTAMDFLQWICHFHLSKLESARVGLHLESNANPPLNAENLIGKLLAVLRDPNELAAFQRSFKEREQVNGEFDLAALMSSPTEDVSGWVDDASVLLNSVYPLEFRGPHLVINGNELRLEPLRRTLVSQLAKAGSTTLRTLYASVPTVPRTSVRAALLDLAQHNILTIHRPA
jgi:ribosomal protein L16 Arg81 hydroxylase